MSGTKVQIVAHLQETFLDILSPHHRVVHAPDMVGEPLGDGVVPLIVPITTDHVPLGGHAVSVAALLREKGCLVRVVWLEGNLVIPVPSVDHGLLHVGGDLGGQLEGALYRECLSLRVIVGRLVINGSSWISIRFGCYHHPG